VPKEYRLSYPCDLFATIKAESLEAAKKKFVECLTPVADGIIVCLDTPASWGPHYDAEERLYPRVDGDGIINDEISLEDGPDGEDEEDEDDPGDQAGVEGGPAAADPAPHTRGLRHDHDLSEPRRRTVHQVRLDRALC